ncbi:phosphoribulokinase / uridine kinase family protein [Cryptosporidium muris RN66]|uniref:Phosphoribulokinase / uridine kinase family protein n=1 Tax=Cryptosporidium muris (strain RN66) TaxID=441375 RepID=B6ABC4_CRYMR|nr:phosphoribulokinase / uridine kinase family protein [Cryptosporidium muris RN66]EEA05676.1 phosphoribulokinase / uridine kinase family protein [Cryptosporidium muris RN66]|eukprot:XP_002140025.1 phosphoribulokinase / uridine kinase family protein [Cryptosporidium muris RN66]
MSEYSANKSADSSPYSYSNCFFIAVAGGSASGKTSVCSRIYSDLGDKRVAVIDSDSFYKTPVPGESCSISEYNFDHPNAVDFDLLYDVLERLGRGEGAEIPNYCFKQHKRLETVRYVSPASIIIVEGIFVLYDPRIRRLYNMSIFVDTDDDIRLIRRIRRDFSERGRQVDEILAQYEKTVKPSYDEYIYPTRRYADLVIPHYPNEVAVDLVVQHLRYKLKIDDLRVIYSNLHIIPSNCQIRHMHTIIRNKNTSGIDFVFWADRLIRIVVENALGHLPFEYQTVETPIGVLYDGVTCNFKDKLCAVSIVRGGESMELGISAICRDIPIGKLLMEFQDPNTELDASFEKTKILYCKLPSDINSRYVFILDPVLGNGFAVSSAIKYLIDRGVLQHKILILSLLAAPNAIHRICRQFPAATLITTEIEKGVTDEGYVIPGVGAFADRYFGTE